MGNLYVFLFYDWYFMSVIRRLYLGALLSLVGYMRSLAAGAPAPASLKKQGTSGPGVSLSYNS